MVNGSREFRAVYIHWNQGRHRSLTGVDYLGRVWRIEGSWLGGYEASIISEDARHAVAYGASVKEVRATVWSMLISELAH